MLPSTFVLPSPAAVPASLIKLTWSKQFFFFFRLSEFFFYPLLARPDIGAGVEQPFGCLIVQNRQAV